MFILEYHAYASANFRAETFPIISFTIVRRGSFLQPALGFRCLQSALEKNLLNGWGDFLRCAGRVSSEGPEYSAALIVHACRMCALAREASYIYMMSEVNSMLEHGVAEGADAPKPARTAELTPVKARDPKPTSKVSNLRLQAFQS